jgi:hypothetical protein
MTIQGCASWRRPTSAVLILTLLAAFADVTAFAQTGSDPAVSVSNQQVRIEGEVAYLSYDLDAPEGATCTITIELRRESDSTFSMVPTGLTGDVGEVKTPGPGKRIRWEYLRDFPLGLHGEDFYFRIDAAHAGGFPWLWVGLGSAAAAGAVAVILSGKSSGSPAPAGMQELPMPPSR